MRRTAPLVLSSIWPLTQRSLHLWSGDYQLCSDLCQKFSSRRLQVDPFIPSCSFQRSPKIIFTLIAYYADTGKNFIKAYFIFYDALTRCWGNDYIYITPIYSSSLLAVVFSALLNLTHSNVTRMFLMSSQVLLSSYHNQ